MYDKLPEDGNDRVLKISVLQDDEKENYKDLMAFSENNEPVKMLVQYGRRGAVGYGALPYRNKCAPCHMLTGEGIPKFTPPLIGTNAVANKKKLIETALFGISGELEVKGEKYNDVMPGFAANLTNQELKEILDYVRLSLNSHKDSVTVAEIMEIRSSRTF